MQVVGTRVYQRQVQEAHEYHRLLQRWEIFEEFVFQYFNSYRLPLLSVGPLFFVAFGAEAIVVSQHSM